MKRSRQFAEPPGGGWSIPARDSAGAAVGLMRWSKTAKWSPYRLKRTPEFYNGNLKSVFRCFEIWTSDHKQPLRMSNRLGAGENDPLEQLIARIIDNLKRRTAVGLTSGAVLEGESWSLVGTELTIKDGGQEQTVPLSQIDQAAPCDGMFGIWRNGEHEPTISIRPESKNAPVLFALLADWIHVRQEATDSRRGDDSERSGLGRLLFARRRAELAEAVSIIAFVFAAVGGMLICFEDIRPYAIASCALAALLFVSRRFISIPVFRCHEFAFVQAKGLHEQVIRYRDITEFTYSLKSSFYRGHYLGTNIRCQGENAGRNNTFRAKHQDPR